MATALAAVAIVIGKHHRCWSKADVMIETISTMMFTVVNAAVGQ